MNSGSLPCRPNIWSLLRAASESLHIWLNIDGTNGGWPCNGVTRKVETYSRSIQEILLQTHLKIACWSVWNISESSNKRWWKVLGCFLVCENWGLPNFILPPLWHSLQINKFFFVFIFTHSEVIQYHCH